jgi:hypothetical protein
LVKRSSKKWDSGVRRVGIIVKNMKNSCIIFKNIYGINLFMSDLTLNKNINVGIIGCGYWGTKLVILTEKK